MSTSPRTPPSAALTDSFVALAETLLPVDGCCDRFAVQRKLSAAIHADPRSRTAASDLEREPGAARLLDRRGFQTSTGLGFEGLTAPELLDSMLLATWQRMDISGQQGSHRRVGYTARTILADLCALAAGGVVHVPARILWDGPDLEADRRLHGAFGSLRSKQHVTPPYLEGHTVPGPDAPEAPIRKSRSFGRLLIRGSLAHLNVAERGVDRVISQVRLAMLEGRRTREPEDCRCRSTSGPPARVALVNLRTPSNLSRFLMSAALDRVRIPVGRSRSTRSRASPRLLHDPLRVPRSTLAARRLAASTDQEHRGDNATLVDAVTAWESLLGSTQGMSFSACRRVHGKVALAPRIPSAKRLYRTEEDLHPAQTGYRPMVPRTSR